MKIEIRQQIYCTWIDHCVNPYMKAKGQITLSGFFSFIIYSCNIRDEIKYRVKDDLE